jgi:hypothetical protein
VGDIDSFRKAFVWDNPNLNGADPTAGIVDYSYGMDTNSDMSLVPNKNGDVGWQEISATNPKSVELIHAYDNGIELQLSDEVVTKGGFTGLGAPRVSSRKLFRGGLFVMDVEAMPYGPGLWPAVWFNGFVGAISQYHGIQDTPEYTQGMEKLYKAMKENFNGFCTDPNKPLTTSATPTTPASAPVQDVHMSKFLGKPVYPALWPAGGEFDIIEQVNFSDSTLISIHGGSACEVVIENIPASTVKNTNWPQHFLYDYLDNEKYRPGSIRSVCQTTYARGFGNFSGCNGPEFETDKLSKNGRFLCPSKSDVASGNSQVVAAKGTFGAEFNNSQGGVFAVQWVPQKFMKVFYWARSLFSESLLSKSGGPLSSNPDPNQWFEKTFSDHATLPDGPYQTLQVNFQLAVPDTSTKGCDFAYMAMLINTTVGGNWAGNVIPDFVSVDYKCYGQTCPVEKKGALVDYVKKCYHADVRRASENQYGFDPQNGCYDGAKGARGKDSVPVFFSQKSIKLRKIRVFQTDGDDYVW